MFILQRSGLCICVNIVNTLVSVASYNAVVVEACSRHRSIRSRGDMFADRVVGTTRRVTTRGL